MSLSMMSELDQHISRSEHYADEVSSLKRAILYAQMSRTLKNEVLSCLDEIRKHLNDLCFVLDVVRSDYETNVIGTEEV